MLDMNTPIPLKTGQPMAAVRFSDMQGKSLCMAICSYFSLTSPKKTSPAAARRRNTFLRVHTKDAGGGWGSSRKGRFGGDCLSERGGPSKVFSNGENLIRRGPPRSSPEGNYLSRFWRISSKARMAAETEAGSEPRKVRP